MTSQSKLGMVLVVIVGLVGVVLAARVTIPILFPPPTPTPLPTSTPVPTSTPTPTPLPTPTPTPTPIPTNTPTPLPTDTPTPLPTDTPTPEPTVPPPPTEPPPEEPTVDPGSGGEAAPVADCSVPAAPQSTIGGRRIISYYGTTGPGLGILGRHDIGTTITLLFEQIAPYRQLDPCVEVVPAFHIITTVADASPGEDGDYNHRMPHEAVQLWMDSIAAQGGISILDLQL